LTAREASDLKRTQELFWALITAPAGVRPSLDDLQRRGVVSDATLAEVFVGDDRLSAVDRVDIYANMYFYRLLDCLREDFPRVEAALGGERFHNLVTDYLLHHPSRHPSLRYLGESMPEFIRSHAIASEVPYVTDLARLEWGRVEAFDAPDVRPMTREDLARLPQERAGEVRMTLVPALGLYRFDYDVYKIWRDLKEPGAVDDGAPGTEGNAAMDGHDHFVPARGPRNPKRTRVAVRIWRSDFIVYHKRIGEEEAHCLELVAAGEGLGRICQLLAAGGSPERATARVGQILQGWIDDGLIADLTLPDA
jgi:hypothetical protein